MRKLTFDNLALSMRSSYGGIPVAQGTAVRRGQQGFTLIELMVVVAVVGILASIAVYMFTGQKNKATARSEVSAMFAEIELRQEQYRLENGAYLSTGTADTDTWPTAPAAGGGKTSILATEAGYPTEWADLRMAPDMSATHCAYVTIAGEGGDDTNIGSVASGDFNFTEPDVDWFYILARCDMDQNSAVDSFYFKSSGDSELYFINQGK